MLEFENVAVIFGLTLLVVYFLLHLRTFQLLESEPGLEGQEREGLESQLKFFGPAGIIVLAWRCMVSR